MKKSEALFGILRVASDAIAVASALLLAYFLRIRNVDLLPGVQLLEPAQTLPEYAYYLHQFILPATALFTAVAAALHLYLIRVTLSAFRELARIVLSVVVWVGLIMGWYFFVQKQLFFSRAILIHATGFVFILVTSMRTLLTLLQRRLLKTGIGVRTVLSVGTRALPRVVEEFLNNDPRYRYLGQVRDANDLKRKRNLDLVLQTDPGSSDVANNVIDICRSHHFGYAFIPPVLTDVPHLLSVYRFGSVPVLRFHPTPLDGWGAVAKRIFDLVCATFLLILLLPFALWIALLIMVDSRGSVFYVSRRIGEGGKKHINVLKFRSMVCNADAQKTTLQQKSHRSDGPLFKIKNDPRITTIGKWLRRYSVDEWPQLLNVLNGDLSLVGPRPHLPDEVQQYSQFQRRVFAVKPGITGLAQISGRSDLAFQDEVRLDLQYIEEWSPWLDLFILWRTFWVVLKGQGAD